MTWSIISVGDETYEIWVGTGALVQDMAKINWQQLKQDDGGITQDVYEWIDEKDRRAMA